MGTLCLVNINFLSHDGGKDLGRQMFYFDQQHLRCGYNALHPGLPEAV